MLACTAPFPAAGQVVQEEQFDIKQPILTSNNITLWGTYYHIWPVKESPSGIPFIDQDNKPLSGKVSPSDWCKGAIEGTVLLSDESGGKKTLNFLDAKGPSQVDCRTVLGINPIWIDRTGRSRFSLAKGKYGDGVKGFKLVPFRTIAVDPSVIPYGSALFIPAIKGLEFTLQSGSKARHDGYFFAADTGAAIKGNHIDFFIGTSKVNPFPAIIKSNKDVTFKAYIVDNPAIILKLKSLHSPSVSVP